MQSALCQRPLSGHIVPAGERNPPFKRFIVILLNDSRLMEPLGGHMGFGSHLSKNYTLQEHRRVWSSSQIFHQESHSA